MAVTTIIDLPTSRALDYQAALAIKGAGAGDWCIGAFPFWIAPVALPRAVDIFNFYQQIINNVSNTYIGQQSTQVTSVSINAGSNSNNTALLIGSSTSNHA